MASSYPPSFKASCVKCEWVGIHTKWVGVGGSKMGIQEVASLLSLLLGG